MICELALTVFPLREIFSVVVYIGFFFFDYVCVPIIGLIVNRILPDKAKRNLVLTTKDQIFINFNRLVTIIFLYHIVQLACSVWFTQDSSIFFSPRLLAKNLLIFAAVYFPSVVLIYDLGYTT